MVMISSWIITSSENSLERLHPIVNPMKNSMIFFLLAPYLLCSCQNQPKEGQPDAETKIEVKVVVVAMFESGLDTGDRPGEFQNWVERLPLEEVVAFPHGYRDLRWNKELGVLGLVTGIGTAKSAASVMALGLDRRFDLSRAYWIIAGISGIDPEDAPPGSAAWAEWVIDGDLSHQIDAREIEDGWPTGYIPLRLKEPYQQPVPEDNEGAAYHLNPDLVDWAYNFTKDIELQDNPQIQEVRNLYTDHPSAQTKPRVLKGDHLAAMTYWHGKLLNQWANDWVSYWSQGKGNFVTSAMEDTGTLQSLTFLAKSGRVDLDRVLVLRSGSNFTMQYPGVTAGQSLAREKLGKGYTAYLPALDAAYRAGSAVVRELVANWEEYQDSTPQ